MRHMAIEAISQSKKKKQQKTKNQKLNKLSKEDAYKLSNTLTHSFWKL